MGVGVGVTVGVGFGAGVFESKSSSSNDAELLRADDVDDSNEVASDNVVVADVVEAARDVELVTVADATGVGIGWRCFR